MSCDPFLTARLTKIEAQIEAAEDAILDYSGDGIISYTFNTGQTVSTVAKASLKDMLSFVDSLYSRRDTLRQRCGLDSASFNAAPGW